MSHPLSRVAVVQDRGQLQVRATVALRAGEPILAIDGSLVDRPSRYTIQVDEHRHLEARPGPDGAPPAWQFLNHACSPSAVLRDRTLLALVAIPAGAEITFDYTTTEWDMHSAFPCHCGSPACLGIVRGFRHLTSEQMLARLPYLAPHLRQHVAAAAVRGKGLAP